MPGQGFGITRNMPQPGLFAYEDKNETETLITGQPVSERRIRLGAFAYAVGFAATFSFAGFVISDIVTSWL